MNTGQKSKKEKTKGGYRQELTKRQKEDIKTAFALFDTDGSGTIEHQELKVALRAQGFEVKQGEIKRLMDNLNSEGKDKEGDNKNTQDLQEFIQIMELKTRWNLN